MNKKVKKPAFLQDKKFMRTVSIIATILVMFGFFAVAFFVGFGVRSCTMTASADELSTSSYTVQERIVKSSVYRASSPTEYNAAFTSSYGFNLSANTLTVFSSYYTSSSAYTEHYDRDFTGLLVEDSFSYDGFEYDYVFGYDVGGFDISSGNVFIGFIANNVPRNASKSVSFIYEDIDNSWFPNNLKYTFYTSKFGTLSYDYCSFLFIRFDDVFELPEYNSSSVSFACLIFPHSKSVFGTPAKGIYTPVYSGVSDDYTSGYNAGLQTSQNKAYTDGFDAGYNQGHEEGYNDGVNTSLSQLTPLGFLTVSVNSFMNTKILGNITFGLIFSISFGVILVGILLKIFVH